MRLVAIAVLSLYASASLAADRVAQARASKYAALRTLFKTAAVAYPPDQVLIRVFKAEKQLELWAGAQGQPLVLIKTYPVCALSGKLGPKRKQGDFQVPEGFYHLVRFNPNSNFHLSLGIDYPNESDRLIGGQGNLGGDIFIHGSCATIGCIPIRNDPIEEVYLVALDARAHGHRSISVYIFPRRMNVRGLEQLKRDSAGDRSLKQFWIELEPGYRLFEASHRLPAVKVDPQGRYIISG
jgi:murein L,D-transpeptidase YafK